MFENYLNLTSFFGIKTVLKFIYIDFESIIFFLSVYVFYFLSTLEVLIFAFGAILGVEENIKYIRRVLSLCSHG